MELDLNKFPKLFMDSVAVGYGKEHFVLGIKCGEDIHAFVLTRIQVKNFVKDLSSAILQSEKMYGVIPEESTSGVKSPLDLSGPKPKSP